MGRECISADGSGVITAGAKPGSVGLFDPQVAEAAETLFTAFASTEQVLTARLRVRRIRDQSKLEELFPVCRHHPSFIHSDEPTLKADLTGSTRSSRPCSPT